MAPRSRDIYFLLCDLEVVHRLKRHAVARRSDDADRVVRHENIGVGRFAAAVDHHVVDAVAEDEQCAPWPETY